MKWRYGIVCLVAVCVIITVLLVVLLPNNGDDSVVVTSVGTIRGARSTLDDYYEFFGIPYGKVNESNLFGAANPYPPFDDIFEANERAARCPQFLNGEAQGTIDCLQFDVYVPASASSDNPLAVMVYIHGGSFEIGSKTIKKPYNLIRYDVILVSINYRVGPYGFICVNSPEAPGNQGLKDQELALRWVKNNIEAFGGDANKITLFGISAGGHSVDFHLLSDSEILFNKAILQSGSSVASTVFADHDERAPMRIAEQLGFYTDSISDAVTYLSSVSPDIVISASRSLNQLYKPCTENRYENVEAFLTRPWINADAPKVRNMPIMIGYCEHEMLLRYVNPGVSSNLTVIRDRLTDTFNFDEDNMRVMEQLIHDFYFADLEAPEDLLFPATYMDSDYTYIYPVRRSINNFLRSEAESVFFYQFSYNGGRNLDKIRRNVTIGSAIHGDDFSYLFDNEDLPDQVAPEDQIIIDRLTQMWTNFAKYGDPTPEISDVLPVRWIPITSASYNYLRIDSTLTLGTHPANERMTFWDDFYTQNAEYEKGYPLNSFK